MKYKFLDWDEKTDDSIEVEFDARNNFEANNYALEHDAQLDDDGKPYVYIQNRPTSHFGCGHNCSACCGWLLINEQITMHGDVLGAFI
jgi:hypothetical protein